jgi:TetR/AcrR family transcriptional regulator, lmrAB and yxaGH operons repressor
MRLFRRQGYAATGLQQILAESDSPKGSLYHYFPGGKEALAEAAVELAGNLVADLLADLGSRHSGDPAGFLEAYCSTMAGWMEESEFRSGCPIATTILETVPASPTMTTIANQLLDRWTEIIAIALAPAARSSSEATRLAGAVIAAVEGALILARIRRSTAPLLDIPRSFGPITGSKSSQARARRKSGATTIRGR